MSDAMSAILKYVKDRRKLDFSVYRPDTIRRRLEQRLSATGSKDSVSYLQCLLDTPAEIDQLITTLTITTSHFFRDPLVFDVLEKFILPELLETFRHETLRIWCAGCGRGEESYSMAILVSNLERLSGKGRSAATIIATDVDKKALEEASDGCYDPDALREVRKRDVDRYFNSEQEHYRIGEDIRSMVTFAYHDVTTCCTPREGIFSDYHIVLCRNVLMYFNRETQDKILRDFRDVLRRQGYLVLGEAEMISDGDFVEVFPRTRIFRKGGRAA